MLPRMTGRALLAVVATLLAASVGLAASIEHTLVFDELDLTLERAGGYDLVRLRGCDLTTEPGSPELPLLSLTLALPPGARVTGIEITSAESSELLGRFRPRPAQHPRILPVRGLDLPVPDPVVPAPSVYEGRRPYPPEIVELASSGRLASSDLVGIRVHPVQFLPATGKLRLFRNISLRVDYDPPERMSPRPRAPRQRAVVAVLSENVPPIGATGPTAATATRLEDGDYEHVILVQNAYFAEPFGPLAEWKTRKGVPSTIVQVSWVLDNYPGADDAERVRNFIRDARDSWGATWFLLAGDTDRVPARRAYAMTSEAGGHPEEDELGCDSYFSDLDGSWDADGDGIYGELEDDVDLYPDVFVGRAPITSLDNAEAFVSKLIDYERTPVDDFQLDMLMAAEVLWQDPYTDSGIALNRIDRDYVPPRYDPINKLYETLGNESGESVRAAINDGVGHFLHSGHAWYTVMGCGDGDLHRWEIADLTNARRQPLVYSIGCWPAAFDLTEACIAERFLQSSGGGAVAFIGNSRYGWASPGNPGYGYSERFMQEFYRVLFSERVTSAGAALAAAKARFIPFSQEKNVYRWHQYQLNLLGDPEMPVWTTEPAALAVTHPDSVLPGPSALDVVVRTSGGPVEGALVCATNGQDVYERDRTSQDGAVTLSIDTVLPDSVLITVTAPDCRPYEGAVPVVFSGAFLRTSGSEIDDAAGGNADGLPGPGETVGVSVSLRNFGNEAATGVEASLSSDDPMVEVLSAQSYYGDIAGGATAPAATSFEVSIAPECPNGHVVVLDVEITSAAARVTWAGSVALTVAAPVLVVEGYSVDDTWGGDGDGVAEPGEGVRLMLAVKNEGLAGASSPLFSLTSMEPGVQVVTGTASLPSLEAGENGQVVFDIDIEPDLPSPGFPELSVEASTSDGLYTETTLRVAVGGAGFAFDFESGAPGWTHGGASDTWVLTAHRSHSGATSWYVGAEGVWQYADNADAHLDSPEFVLGSGAELSFWCWYEFPIYHEDGFYVQVLADGAPVDTLDFIGSGGALDLLGSIGNDWLEYRYSLQGSVGDTLQVRFSFTSDDSDVAEGVYIDDVTVTSADAPSDTGAEGEASQEARISLQQNHPNPFSPSTSISFALTAEADVQLAVYNIQGRLIRTLVDETRSAGDHEVNWDGTDEYGVDVAAGVYLYRLRHGELEETRKMILVR